MTSRKRTTNEGPPPGRGQEEFRGDFADALRYANAWAQAARERAARPGPETAPGRGPMRSFAVGWSLRHPDGHIAAMSRAVVIASCENSARRRAPQHFMREAGIADWPGAFEIRYVKELR